MCEHLFVVYRLENLFDQINGRMKRVFSPSKRCLQWKLCYVCQADGAGKKTLRHTKEGATSLAENLLRYWKAGKLEFDVSGEVDFKDGEPDFLTAFLENTVKYHNNCVRPYRKPVKNEPNISQHANLPERPETRSMATTMPFNSSYCACCSQYDFHTNMRAAGTLHACKDKVDTEHNQALTDKWKLMAAVLERQDILQRLASGDLAANSLFYYDNCYKKFINQYYRKLKESDCSLNSGGMTQNMIRDLAFAKVIQYLHCNEASNPGSSYIVLDLEDIYLKCLAEHGLYNKSHVTSFTNLLVEKVPSLKATKCDNKNTVVFEHTVQRAVQDFIAESNEDIAFMQKICVEIRQEIFSHCNRFTGFVDDQTQEKSVPRKLLTLVAMLVDGISTSDPSQETHTCAQVIMYNTMKQRSNHGATSYKDKGRETPVMCIIH